VSFPKGESERAMCLQRERLVPTGHWSCVSCPTGDERAAGAYPALGVHVRALRA